MTSSASSRRQFGETAPDADQADIVECASREPQPWLHGGNDGDTAGNPVNGIQMRWEEAGTGQPVALIHGIPTCPGLWRHVVPRLQGARALAWEMVGYGASIPEGRGHDISVGQQAEYLVAWLREIGVERAVLVGHDLGGGVAQIAAVRYPDLVEGLVLMNAIAYDSWPIPSVKVMRALGPAIRHLPNAIFRQVFRLFLLQGHTTRQQAQEAFQSHWPHYTAHGGAAFVHQVRALDVRDTLAIADQLPGLDIPTRLAWGATDQFQQIGYGYRLAHDLRARLDHIEGGKHFVPEDLCRLPVTSAARDGFHAHFCSLYTPSAPL